MSHKFPVIVTLLVGLSGPCARADETSKAAKIEELMRITKAESMSTQVAGQVRAMMMNQLNAAGVASGKSSAEAAEVMNKLVAQIQERLSWQKLKPDYVKLYAEVFTEEEITGIVAFYKTPIGQAMLQKMPLLMSKTMELVQRQTAGMMPEIQKTVDEMREKYKNQPKQ
jgi:hypothetical protein